MNKVPSPVAIGSDLELFLFDNKTASIVPCVGVLEGTKEKPYTPEGVAPGFAIQEDNVMVEYNVPPATTLVDFYANMKAGRNMVLEELHRRHGTRYGLYMDGHNHKFRAIDLQSPQAKQIGCETDNDAYAGGAVRADPPAPGLHRACGGHIHLGGDFKCPDFVSALFAELIISVYAGLRGKVDDPRAKWYGKPGVYRSKPYGIEYRTPNNSWGLSNRGIEQVGSYGLMVARYLTTTPAVTIQKHFRAIPWTKMREYMLLDQSTAEAKRLRKEVIHAAMKTGVPL